MNTSPDSQKEWGKLKLMLGPNRGRYPFCHSLFWDGDVKVLIDPACDPNALQEVANRGGVDVVLLSHYHEDHFAGMHLFPKAKLYIHYLDAPALADWETIFAFYGMEPGTEERIRFEKALAEFFHFTPRKANVELKDTQRLDFGDLHIEVIHTPGHCPGHCCFYFTEPDVLFLADYDLTRFGPWYGDRVSDLDALVKSAEKVRYHPARWKVVAHEEPVFEGDIEDRWKPYLAVVDRREAALLDFLSEPRTMDEIAAKRFVYGKAKEPASFYEFGERGIMQKHLDRLLNRGIIRKEGNHYLKIT
jgi:glyoxylase-like metal-dependent hydrolase (beta-lactamase superfamily II)